MTGILSLLGAHPLRIVALKGRSTIISHLVQARGSKCQGVGDGWLRCLVYEHVLEGGFCLALREERLARRLNINDYQRRLVICGIRVRITTQLRGSMDTSSPQTLRGVTHYYRRRELNISHGLTRVVNLCHCVVETGLNYWRPPPYFDFVDETRNCDTALYCWHSCEGVLMCVYPSNYRIIPNNFGCYILVQNRTVAI
eukprot:1194528-Prorocentrum_minimum.AAC.3